jgi:predicted amino acid racemase
MKLKAYINHQGVRFVGMTGFQTTQPQGILETILERLKATTLKSGKRVFIESADECVAYHNVPNVEAIAILNEYGIAVNLAGNDMLLERKTE